MKLQQEFLLYIANKVFGDSLSEEKACFLRRFDPQYHPEKVTDKKFQTNKHIAELINNDLPAGYCGHDKIGLTIRQTIKAISGKYKEEMSEDQVNIDALFGCNQGGKLQSAEGEDIGQKFSPWQEVYQWLWEHKYPRWLEANSWEILREKATSPANWIGFLTEEDKQKVLAGETRVRRPSRPASVEKITEKIPVNQPLYLEVNLEYPQNRLLLVNGNTEGKYLFCPSLDFAPDNILEKPPFVLPQADSWAEKNGDNEKILFEDVRLEEFMGIILDKDVNFDWMKPSEEESLPEWNGQRIMDVFNHLEKSGEWQVFYQSFEVL